MMRKSVKILTIAATCFLPIVFAFVLLRSFFLPAPSPDYPNETQLRGLFETRKGAFEQLYKMWVQDNFVPFRVGITDENSYGLSFVRMHTYRQVILTIDPSIVMVVNGNHVAKLITTHGESSLSVGSEWSNGIEFISADVEKRGHIVDTSSKINLKEEQTYLIPLGGSWFIFHEQL